LIEHLFYKGQHGIQG